MPRLPSPVFDRRFLLALGILLLLGLAFPGDVQFINDEALVIGNALEANSRGELAPRGLVGTAGIHYGPLPTWFYQFLLHFTKDLVVISLLKNLLSMALLFGSLLWLGRLCRFPLPGMLPVFMAPFFWQLNRSLWDEGFCHALGLICVAAYLQYVKDGRSRFLWLTSGLVVLLVHIQIKTIFVILAIVLSFLLLDRKRWLERPLANLVPFFVGILICLPYGSYVLRNMKFGGGNAPALSFMERMGSFLQSTMGTETVSFRVWSQHTLPEMYGGSLLPAPLLHILAWTTSIAVLAAVVGFVGDCRRFRRYGATFWSSERSRAFLLCLAIVVQFGVFFLVTGQAYLAHYQLAVWFASFYFFWSGLRYLWKRRPGRVLVSLYAAAQLTVFVATICFVHRNGGSRSHEYGATLHNQMEVARQIVELPEGSQAMAFTRNYVDFRHTYLLLKDIAVERGAQPADGPPLYGLLRYQAVEPGSRDGWLVVQTSEEPFGPFLRLRK